MYTQVDILKEVTQSKSLDGELREALTTGFVPTHGDQAGEKVDSSELHGDNAALIQTPGLVLLDKLSFSDQSF